MSIFPVTSKPNWWNNQITPRKQAVMPNISTQYYAPSVRNTATICIWRRDRYIHRACGGLTEVKPQLINLKVTGGGRQLGGVAAAQRRGGAAEV